MAEKKWSPPPIPKSVVPKEAFDVGEPSKCGLIEFGKGECKDDVVERYRRGFKGTSGVVLVGVAQWTRAKRARASAAASEKRPAPRVSISVTAPRHANARASEGRSQ